MRANGRTIRALEGLKVAGFCPSPTACSTSMIEHQHQSDSDRRHNRAHEREAIDACLDREDLLIAYELRCKQVPPKIRIHPLPRNEALGNRQQAGIYLGKLVAAHFTSPVSCLERGGHPSEGCGVGRRYNNTAQIQVRCQRGVGLAADILLDQ
jgi:hypothetical protein